MKVADLPTDHSTDIKVEAEPKSMTVVEHYDAALTGAGWEKYQPTAESKPGQRKWLSMGVKMGPTDVYDAAWFDPKSGKKALLSVFHTAEAPKVQSGTFEVWEKDDPKAPF